jgi:hypothetical protein
VTFSAAITLPYSFNLPGYGGMLAFNRPLDVEALWNGRRNRARYSIFFLGGALRLSRLNVEQPAVRR